MNRYLVVTSALTDPQWVVVSPVYAVDGDQCIIDELDIAPGELIRVGGNEVNYIETVECTDPDNPEEFACSAKKGQIAIRCSAETQLGDLEQFLDVARYPFSKQHPGDPYHLCVQTGTLGNDTVLLIANPTFELQDPGDRLVGTWELDGTPVGTIDQDLYQQIRPLGNDAPRDIYDDDGNVIGQTKGGNATSNLSYHGVSGDKQRMVGDPTSPNLMTQLYPGVPPFDLEIRPKFFDTPDTPSSTGNGFRVEMHGDADLRDPAQYSTGAYTDDTYETWLWPTVGAFQRGPSEWQTDEEGQPLEVWYQESWDGYRPDEREVWYIAVLNGPTIEGHAILPLEQDSIRYLFWDRDQGGGGEPQPWVQPDGAGGPNFPYSIGDLVTHTGDTWESTVDDNVWEPGVYGWVTV